MSLTLYKSNRMEALAEALATVLRSPPDSPFAAETVVVQSLGMRRWISLQLAEKHGICANCKFPFPKAFVDEVFAAFLPKTDKNFFSDRSALAWRVMKVLPGLISQPQFAPVQNYVSGHSADLKLFQLSEKIASVFDQYIVFRPQMILGWEKGEDNDWQAVLWRELAQGGNHRHQAAQARELAALWQNVKSSSLSSNSVDLPANRLPQRVSIFGISSLPPFYIELLGALSRQMDVHIFLLDPTDQLWAHIISDAEEDRLRRRLKNPQLTAEDLHAQEKNSLLASLGKTGRDFQELILELEPDETKTFYFPPNGEDAEAPFEKGRDDLPLFAAPETSGGTMLSILQADIFHLRDPMEKRAVSDADRSIQFHSCHSPMREMEVLHDQLLALFERNPLLMPKDIIVMMPDVKSYAPFIEAVFGSPETPQKQIPFTIADRGLRVENSLADTFLRILELGRSRFGVGAVLAILESPAVQSAFHLSESDLETIRVWVEKVGIRWGIDAEHRRKFGLPALEQNTWRAGLQRLLLGYALPAGEQRLFEGVLPCDEIEGSLGEVLGNWVEFAERLFSLAEEFEKPRALPEWKAFFFRILSDFFSGEKEFESELYILRKSIASLEAMSEISEFNALVSAEVITAFLKRLLEEEESNSGFITGQVTFCALRPMRSVPFPVVCLAGMSDGTFPRPPRVLGFDKMAEKPKLGDRSNRHEDRYLFLEAILSARDVFYVSYVGQSIRDNAALPPSVLVSELLDYLERGFVVERGPGNEGLDISIEKHLVTQHRLQAFSPSYFAQDERLWSYSAENCAASRTTLRERALPAVFLGQKLAELEAEWRVVEIDSLAKFFCNPAEFFLRHRLGIHLREPKTLLEDREIVELDPLASHGLRQFLAERFLAGLQSEETFEILKASGRAPLGKMGDCHSRHLAEEVKKLSAVVQEYSGKPSSEISLQQRIGDWEIMGTIRDIYPDHLLRFRCANLKSKDILRTWMQHLALNLVRPNATSVFISLDARLAFLPVANSHEVLRQLLEAYWEGLRTPLKFFPEASFTFAERKFRPGKGQKKSPRDAAESAWIGNDFSSGEMENPYFKLCFQHVDQPLDEEWEKLAETVCAPIFDRMQKEAL